MAEAENEVDIQELYAGSMHLSSVCATTGRRVSLPLDLRQDFDFNSQAGQQRAWAQLTKQCPRVTLLSPDDKGCTPGRTSVPKGQPQSDFCAQVASHQRVHGRYFLLIAQSDSTMWARKDVVALSKAPGASKLSSNLQAFGDPYTTTVTTMHNLPAVAIVERSL